MIRLVIVVALVASCTTYDSDAFTVNATTWHIEFDVGSHLVPRDEQPSENRQPDCDPGCYCLFYPANDYFDAGTSSATADYHEVCSDANLDVGCTIDFSSNQATEGGCSYTSITQPGFNDIVFVHLTAL